MLVKKIADATRGNNLFIKKITNCFVLFLFLNIFKTVFSLQFVTFKLINMKNLIIFFLLMATMSSACCQQTTISKEDYLVKSKKQKTAAWILLGGGVALWGAGIIVATKSEADFTEVGAGGIIATIGVLATIGSIPLFIASARNKKKALTVSFKNGITKQYLNGYTVSRYYPAISFAVSF